MIERPRGTRDFDPAALAKHRHVEAALRRTAETFGFREIQTPTIEHLELFTARSGPGIVEELYAFKDKGGRDVTLRPEFTASVMRFYLSELRSLPKPIKVYSIGNCFRYEEPQHGRYREFWQFNVEILGAPSLEADAELLAVAIQSLRDAGLRQTEARVGHIGMLRAFLKGAGPGQAAILHALDKRNFEVLKKELAAANLSGHEETLKRVTGLKGGPEVLDEASRLLAGDAAESVNYLRKLADRLDGYGLRDAITFDLGVVRGLDYYTGMVFEIDSPNLGAEKQVGGGGGYTLAEVLGGEPVASTGFAIGLDRVVLAAEVEGVAAPAPRLDVYVFAIGDAAKPAAIRALQEIRAALWKADTDLVGRGPSKNLDYANAAGARLVVMIGEKELAAGAVALKDMESGQQASVAAGDLVTEITRRLR
ncbi:MAG TPA: histidine--tRNA ligase [Thermoplasmata archaeon]|nr:histidine--tRNA ligase [Thermoplasmata archaeon]